MSIITNQVYFTIYARYYFLNWGRQLTPDELDMLNEDENLVSFFFSRGSNVLFHELISDEPDMLNEAQNLLNYSNIVL